MATPSTPLNVGLIGYGNSTKIFHLPYINVNAATLKVYAFLQRAEAPASKEGVEPGKHCTVDYPEAKHYRDADGFFADPNIDLVIVCTHHDTHASYAEKALLAGKHVAVEKPFTVSSQEADHLIEVAKKSGKILTVYQNRRYDSDFQTLRHLVEKSAFGNEITECEIHYDVDFPWWMSHLKSTEYTPGSGMMFGLGSHTVDQALLLFGKPTSVTGFYRALRGVEGNVDDSFTIILQYTDNADPKKRNLVVTIKTSIVAVMQHSLKYFVRGYDGTFLKFGEDVQEPQINSGFTPTTPGYGEEPEDTYGVLTTKEKFHEGQALDEKSKRWIGKVPSFTGSYGTFYVDLVKAIRGESEVAVKPEQSRDGIRIIELARESADSGRTLAFS